MEVPEPVQRWHLQIPCSRALWAPIHERFQNSFRENSYTSQSLSPQVGTVVSLRDHPGACVPAEFHGKAVTLTEVRHGRNLVKFVDDGRRKKWCLDALEVVPAKEVAVSQTLKHFLEIGGETRCGHFTQGRRYCPWPAPCRRHSTREGAAMAVEDELSRKRDRGICNIVGRNGNVCTNVNGECPYHAPENQRCMSMLNDNPLARCWSYRAAGSYCSNHEDYPDLSVWAKAYAD